jgi:uncharacterized protein (UPF0333 family)
MFRKRKAQASFEFILVLTLTLLLATAFILAITEEYSDTFIISSVKNTAEHNIAILSINKPECWNTALMAMNFSEEEKKITLTVSGCPLNLTEVAAKVEASICGAKVHTGGTSMMCGGVSYTLESA